MRLAFSERNLGDLSLGCSVEVDAPMGTSALPDRACPPSATAFAMACGAKSTRRATSPPSLNFRGMRRSSAALAAIDVRSTCRRCARSAR